MITELRAQNFKSWKDTGTLQCAPLTGFFGANSSGKTSILQVLLMLKQTVERPSKGQSDWDKPLFFGNNASLVNLGDFDEIIHGHTEDLKLDIFVSWKLPEKLRIEFISTDSISFSTSIVKESGHPVLDAYCYTVNGQRWQLERDTQKEMQEWKFKVLGILNMYPNYSKESSCAYPYRFYGVEAPDNRQETLLPLIDSLENLFNRIFYLGPLRESARSHYIWRSKHPEGVGRHGEDMVSALFSSRIQSSDLDEHVPKWLQLLGLIDSYRLAPVPRTQKDYEFLVTKHRGGPEVRLADVGFGVSQVLPVLILCYYAPIGSILILEQPEAHLHPKVQSELGDVLIDVVKNRKLQIILESHSEHLLNRLTRRIAEEEISAEQTAFHFCEIDDGSSKVEQLKVDEYGNISNWPQDFFGDSTGDLIKKTRAEMKRRKEMR